MWTKPELDEFKTTIRAAGEEGVIKVGHGETAGVTAKLLGKQGGAKPGTFGRLRLEHGLIEAA